MVNFFRERKLKNEAIAHYLEEYAAILAWSDAASFKLIDHGLGEARSN